MVGESARWILPLFAHCGGGLSSKGQNWCQKRLFNYVHRQLFKHDVWLPCSNLLKMILGIFLFFDVIFLTLMKSLGLIADTPITLLTFPAAGTADFSLKTNCSERKKPKYCEEIWRISNKFRSETKKCD